MILLLALLASVTFGISAWLVMPNAPQLLVVTVMAFIAVTVLVLSKRRALTVYSFFLVALLCPKVGSRMGPLQFLEYRNMTYFTIAISAIEVAMCVQAMRLTDRVRERLTLGRMLVALMTSTVAIHMVAAILRLGGDTSATIVTADNVLRFIIAKEQIVWVSPLLGGLVVWMSARRLRKTSEFETCAVILVVFAWFMVFESLAYYYFSLPLPLQDWVIGADGRYRSMLLTDYNIVAVVGCAAVVAGLYLARRYRWLGMISVAAFFIPLMATQERATIVAAVVAISAYSAIWAVYAGRRLAWIAPVVGCIVVAAVWFGSPTVKQVQETVETSIRPDYFTSFGESWVSRFGAHYRAMDVIADSLPLGVGPGRVDYFMASTGVPTRFASLANENDISAHFYWNIASGTHVTGPHNLFLNFAAEYGLLGITGMALLLIWLVAEYRVTFDLARGPRKNLSIDRLRLRCVSLAGLSGLFFFGLYQHDTAFWLIGFFMAGVSAADAIESRAPVIAADASVRMRPTVRG